MAVAAAITVFIGFYPTYYLKAFYDTQVLSPLVHAHGLLFTAWIGLLIIQTSLVALHRVDWHRRLGIAGAILAVLMTAFGLTLSIAALQRGRLTPAFFAVPRRASSCFRLW